MAISFYEKNDPFEVIEYWKTEILPARINGRSGVALVELLGKVGTDDPTELGLVNELISVADKQGMRSARVDLSKYLHEYSKDPTCLGTALLRELSLDMSNYETALGVYHTNQIPGGRVVTAYQKLNQEDRLYRRPDWLTAYRQVVMEQVKCVNQLAHPVLQVLENIDSLDNSQRAHLEEWLVSPMVNIPGSVLLVTNSRRSSGGLWERLWVRGALVPLRI